MKRSLFFLTMLAVFAASADAQRIDSPYQFLDHGQFGGIWGGHVQASDGRLDMGPQPAPIFGNNYANRVSGPFALYVDVGYMPSTRTVRDTTFEAADSLYTSLGEADINLLTAMGNLRFNLTGSRTWNGLQPFVIVGAGMALDLASGSEIEEDLQPDQRFDFGTSFAGQLGAGVDWFATPRMSVRVEARDMFWKLPVPEAFLFTENGAGLPGSDWVQNFALAAGLSIHF
jgi:opacity protein-like surface antigen